MNGITQSAFSKSVVVCAVLLLAASGLMAQTWTQVATTTAPPTGITHAAHYDAASNRLIVFVRPDGAGSNEVWVLLDANNLGPTPNWVKLALATPFGAPPVRHAQADAYDAANNRLIIFGGCNGGCFPVLNDVWVLTNANGLGGTPTWIPLAPGGTPPSGRAHPRAGYDPASNRMMVFGGQNGGGFGGATFPEVWILSNANGMGGAPAWQQLATAGPFPPGQYLASVNYDPGTNRLIAFGGAAQGTGASTNATYVLSNANGLGGSATWMNLVPEGATGSPPPRSSHMASYDAAENKLIVAGGCDLVACVNNEAWVLSNANGSGVPSWTSVAPGGGPTVIGAGDLDAANDRLMTWSAYHCTTSGCVPAPETFVLSNALGGAPPPSSGISVVPASTITAAPLCKPGFPPPQCYAAPFDTTADLAYQGNGFARPAVAKDSIQCCSSIHQPEFANDGSYGNGTSWISDSSNSWLKVDLGRTARIDRVTFGRDRLGYFDDRDPGQFRIYVALADNVYADGDDSNDASEYTLIFDSSSFGFNGVISGPQTIQAQFAPVDARFVKIEVEAFGAAIDELEVFGTTAGASAQGGPFAYIPNANDHTVSVVDTATNTVTATIPVSPGFTPLGVAVHPSGRLVYVANVGNSLRGLGSVSVIDTTTNTVTANISTVPGSEVGFCGMIGVAVNPAGTRLYVQHVPECGGRSAPFQLVVVDTATNEVVAMVDAGFGGAWGIAVNPAGTRVYMANPGTDSISVIDTASNTRIAEIPVSRFPIGIALNPAGTMAYVGNFFGNTVSVIDTATNTVIAEIPTGSGASTVAVNPAGTLLYVANTFDNTVSVIDMATNTVIATVPVGTEPFGVAVNPAGTHAYVANAGSNDVSVIDTATDMVVATVGVGSRPNALGQFIAPATCTPAPPGLVGWWPGDGNANDISGTNHGTLQGGATFAPGQVGPGLDLDGRGAYVRVPNQLSLNTPDGLTVDAWIYPRALGGARDIASKWDDPTGQWSWIFKLHNDGSGRLRIEISRGDHNALGDLGGVTLLPLNTWSHVAATYDRLSGRLRLYVNGALDSQGSARFIGVPINNSAADLLIGAVNGQITPPVEHFDGLIDELELYDRELSFAEIHAVFKAGSAGKCPITNSPPVADAGSDQVVEATGASTQVTLDGSGSSDPDAGQMLSYEWRDAGNNVVGTNATVAVSLPLGSHTFTLTVNDGNGASASDTVMIIVQDTTAPSLMLAYSSYQQILPIGTSAISLDVLALSGASATDAVDPAPAITSNAPAQFAAGVTNVTLTATDDSGNFSQAAFTVTLLTPSQAIQQLSGMVQSFNFQQGLSNSLDSKLENAQDALDAANAGNRGDAANKLQAFINSVEAQRGNHITNAQADQLIAAAQAVLAAI